MNCPFHRTAALGFDADSSGGSGNPTVIGATGGSRTAPNPGDWSGLVGKRMYRLTETAPTA
jgi:hypothetical protein